LIGYSVQNLTQVLYTTTIKPATKKAHVEALVVAEVVATDMAPKVPVAGF
jgi:hypothetical protein